MHAPTIQALAHRFETSFPEGPPRWRTVGREAEYPLVRDDGSPGDLSELWPILAGPGRTPSFEKTGLQVGLAAADHEIVAEVGVATVELITGPCQDLNQLHDNHTAAMNRLRAAAREVGQHLIGYGIQPVVPPTPAVMTGKQRYGVLLDIIGPPWLWFTLTASDQVHGSITRGELIPATNTCNALAGVTVALCANSPIFANEDQAMCSSREGRMGEIHAGVHRHGMPAGPDADVTGLVTRLCQPPLLLTRTDGVYASASGNVLDHIAGMGGADAPGAWDAFLMHEHYIWNSARPRTGHATLEMRAACQQPLDSHMAAAALGFSMVEAHAALGRWITESLGDDPWPALAAWHHAVVRQGLAAPDPAPGFLAGVLDRCEAAMAARGRGEERHLRPLRARLDARQNPAQAAQAAYARGGMAGLLTHVRG